MDYKHDVVESGLNYFNNYWNHLNLSNIFSSQFRLHWCIYNIKLAKMDRHPIGKFMHRCEMQKSLMREANDLKFKVY